MTVESSTISSMRAGNQRSASRAGALLLGLMAIYFVAHVITRTLVSSNLQREGAEQLVVTQQGKGGYGSQPPLYAWVQKGLFAVLGPGVFALSLMKNVVLWSAYAFVYLAGREL